jgi:hypothetical protein
MDAPDTEPPLRLSAEKKLKKNLTGKKNLIFVSKSLFDLKVKQYQENFGRPSSFCHESILCVSADT